jgi:mRNA interferase YafQ
MYKVKSTKAFEKSYQKIKHSGLFKKQARENFIEAVAILASGEKLSAEYRDHQLSGELKYYRECHIKGDLLLVYEIQNHELVLLLIDIGTHSYLNL